MLKDSLYRILNISGENNAIEAIIELDEHHDIFKGHFPGQPVLPGVCMLQITKEILEIFFSIKYNCQKQMISGFWQWLIQLKTKN